MFLNSGWYTSSLLSLTFLIDMYSASLLFNHCNKSPPTICPVIRLYKYIYHCSAKILKRVACLRVLSLMHTLNQTWKKMYINFFNLIFLSHLAPTLCRSNRSSISRKKIYYSFCWKKKRGKVFSHCSHLFNWSFQVFLVSEEWKWWVPWVHCCSVKTMSNLPKFT